MKNLYTFLFLFSSTFVFGQFEYNFNYYVSDNVTCNGSEISQPRYVDIYQTFDNTPNGERDTTRCFPVTSNWPYKIDVSEMDTSRYLFAKGKIDSLEYPIPANDLFSIDSYLNSSQIYLDPECENGDCTKLYLTTTVPSEDSLNLIYKTSEHYYYYNQINDCLISQKFDYGQYLVDATIQLSVNYENLENNEINIPGLSIYYLWEEIILSPEENTFYIGEEYSVDSTNYQLDAADYFESYYYMKLLWDHNQEGYPSNENRRVIEIYPEVPSEEPVNITFQLYEGDFYFQDFVSMRGGQINDTTFHNLIFDFFNPMCLFFVEIVAEDNTVLNFRKGSDIHMEGESACIQIRKNGKMIVSDQHTLHYGEFGRGNILLKENAHIEIQPGSELILDANVILADSDGDLKNNNIDIKLPIGAHLSFTEFAYIDNAGLDDLKLDIYMNGGTLDMSKLSVQNQRKLNLIYPNNTQEDISIYPSVTDTYLQISNAQKEDIIYKIVDSKGQIQLEGNVNEYQNFINVQSLNSGMYFIQIQKGYITIGKQFVKI